MTVYKLQHNTTQPRFSSWWSKKRYTFFFAQGLYCRSRTGTLGMSTSEAKPSSTGQNLSSATIGREKKKRANLGCLPFLEGGKEGKKSGEARHGIPTAASVV